MHSNIKIEDLRTNLTSLVQRFTALLRVPNIFIVCHTTVSYKSNLFVFLGPGLLGNE